MASDGRGYPESSLINRYCAECEEAFAAQEPLQFICDDCKPYCKGCTRQFNPSSRTAILCVECEIKIAQEICTCCSTMEYPNREGVLDKYGHCPDCADESSKYDLIDHGSDKHICKSCPNELFDKDYILCNNCLVEKVPCPQCKENVIYKTEYCCEECEKRLTRAEKIFKLPH